MYAEHRCIIEDDFNSVAAKLAAADAVVFASPVYFVDLSESLRLSWNDCAASKAQLNRVLAAFRWQPVPGGAGCRIVPSRGSGARWGQQLAVRFWKN